VLPLWGVQESRDFSRVEVSNYYHLNIPFSQEELRNKRRLLMKSAHPDSGGSTEEAEKINRYYDVLKELLQ